MENVFFDSWESIARTAVISVFAYVSLVCLLRIAGKRTLSKMSAFDLIVTIALGSTLATVMLNKDVALADGVLVFALLAGFQYIISFLAVRNKKFRAIVKSTPTLIAYKGRLLDEAMKKERITAEEVFAVVREKGLSTLDEAAAIILETDGNMTVIREIRDAHAATLTSLKNYPPAGKG